MINVERLSDDPLTFRVSVREGGGETCHRVTISEGTVAQLGQGRFTPEQCIEASFRFVVDREPKESILREFDVAVIARYFPEYEAELPRYLSDL